MVNNGHHLTSSQFFGIQLVIRGVRIPAQRSAAFSFALPDRFLLPLQSVVVPSVHPIFQMLGVNYNDRFVFLVHLMSSQGRQTPFQQAYSKPHRFFRSYFPYFEQLWSDQGNLRQLGERHKVVTIA